MKAMANSNSDANIKRNERQPKAQARVVKEGVVVEKSAADPIITTKRDGSRWGQISELYRFNLFGPPAFCRIVAPAPATSLRIEN
jgi:hypothetical protein